MILIGINPQPVTGFDATRFVLMYDKARNHYVVKDNKAFIEVPEHHIFLTEPVSKEVIQGLKRSKNIIKFKNKSEIAKYYKAGLLDFTNPFYNVILDILLAKFKAKENANKDRIYKKLKSNDAKSLQAIAIIEDPSKDDHYTMDVDNIVIKVDNNIEV